MKRWFYKINPETKTVERYDELDNLLGSMTFDGIAFWRKNSDLSLEGPGVIQLYFIAYDELIDRGLVKEEE